ncbi:MULTISPECIES: FkbM family methyltransferase [unclassified Mesorhizobium]|uniref:FkbM family methyltransferase n=1 Tax=unclassified Mesorhizobium TaxID=325217 RepID=UPI000FD59037|nr:MULTISPECIES: FkbM family methyltransferase [unclassified Mesorhizobium]RUV97132.1 FkbM family methyltransferase [Mesorhizobium sp. M5C.F.Ca.IN.020.14.1.1]RUV28882.1 FkbM family methyltransferase [Mesorhizobium sp. M5C.F.Ca.IN.020.32.2.1]RWG50005.1 MAG: FkbM family methyltransferase [Mesorhizobium sp.]RWH50976.1 MAG: FkbM family methyltransferase [Mesorhizobium sp.]RWH58966.1 MAG: FkbM family methyltransferase [Mesorhizobium sp.]
MSRLKEVFRKAGFNVTRIGPNTDPWSRRIELLRQRKVGCVLDVGAHYGGFGNALYRAGFDGALISFEPLPQALDALRRRASRQNRWSVVPVAIGDRDATAEFSVSSRTTSSSLFAMTALAERAANAREESRISVPMRSIDSYCKENLPGVEKVYLKCDVQGAESLVIQGAMETMVRAEVVELELSLVPLYESYWEFSEALRWFSDHGFNIWSIEPGFADQESGRVYQVDVIFARQI